MDFDHTNALSPLDGRYASKIAPLRAHFSEAALIRNRIRVEIAWLRFLSEREEIGELPRFSAGAQKRLGQLAEHIDESDIARVKMIEARTNHDVKAVEYFIKERLADHEELARNREWVHFACTSEDINNLAYALMVRDARNGTLLPAIDEISQSLRKLAEDNAALAMLSLTHGQPASPTTLGKEIANFVYRLHRKRTALSEAAVFGKCNGAVGNFNAHRIAFPDIDWPALGAAFVASLDLEPNPYTTQIEPHDWLAEMLFALSGLNTVLTDLARDIWAYISRGYFRLRTVPGEVGSSTMPHKVNPIDFENAEGNFGLAQALAIHLATTLPTSRLQRDLTDSTALRNIGVVFGHSLLGYRSLSTGLSKLQPDEAQISADLKHRWELLAEPIQTLLRKHGGRDPYEMLKELTRGRAINRQDLQDFIDRLPNDLEGIEALRTLRPGDYTGFAKELTEDLP